MSDVTTKGTPVSLLTAEDLHLFNEGTHYRLARKLGAHPMTSAGRRGTYFAVWAPNARAVSVIGDWNGWERGSDPLAPRTAPASGRGSCRAPATARCYKYAVAVTTAASSREGRPVRASAPSCRRGPPRSSGTSATSGTTREWMRTRAERNALDAPISIYEVHLGSWRRGAEDGNRPLTYRELARAAAGTTPSSTASRTSSCCPVMEHPFSGSWGYQTTGYFAPTSRYGTPQDLMALIDALHPHGIGVILDWVPSHFPTDAHGLALLRRHAPVRARRPAPGLPPRLGQLIFNYGRHEVRELPALERAALARRATTSTACGSTPSPRCSTSTTRASAGEWIPNEYGGRENLEAIDFLRRAQRAPSTPSIPDVQTYRRGVDRVADGVAADLRWAASASASSGTWAGCTTRSTTSATTRSTARYHHDELTFRGAVRLHRELRAAALARRGRARQGLAARARCPATSGRSSPTCALLLRLHVRAAGQEAALHGRRARPVGRVEPRRRASTGTCSSTPAHAGHAAAGSADLNRAYRERAGAARARLRPGRLRVGRRLRQRRERARVPAPAPRRPRRRAGGVQLHAGPAAAATASASRRPGVWRELLNSDAGRLRRQRGRQPGPDRGRRRCPPTAATTR